METPQAFKNTLLPDVYRPYIKLIEESGVYLVGLINDILDLSKIEAGRLELHCSPVDLISIFQGVIATSIGLVKSKPVQLRTDFPNELPAVWADPLRARQILLNLISNAIKFTETGSVTLEAHVDGSFMRISVIDTGIGIPEEALATIFDRFQQAQHDTDQIYGGTGLGLDISRQLTQMHKGELTVKSVVGQGSTFSFTLPLATLAQTTSQEPTLELDSTAIVFDTPESDTAVIHSILLVEDEVSTREMFQQTLDQADYLVLTAHGAEVFEMASAMLPELIILDANLANGSGEEMLTKLKADVLTASIPVILYTADSSVTAAVQAGSTVYLHKPATANELLASVQQILSNVVVNGDIQ